MKGLLLVIAAALLWASDGPLFRYSLLSGGLAPETIVFYEHLLLALIFLPTIIGQGQRFCTRSTSPLWPQLISPVGHFAVIGMGGAALATVCYTRAFFLINPSLVIVLQKLQPLVVVLMARWLLREPISKNFILWAGLCLLATFLISYSDLRQAWSELHPHITWQAKSVQGYLYTLIAIVGWGAATVYGRKLALLGYSERQMMAGRYGMAAIALLSLMIGGGHSFLISSQQLSQIAGMAILSGLLGVYLYYRGLHLVSARVCTLGELFFPLGAVALNWSLLGLAIHPLQLVGGGLLLLGATMIQIKHY